MDFQQQQPVTVNLLSPNSSLDIMYRYYPGLVSLLAFSIYLEVVFWDWYKSLLAVLALMLRGKIAMNVRDWYIFILWQTCFGPQSKDRSSCYFYLQRVNIFQTYVCLCLILPFVPFFWFFVTELDFFCRNES